MSNVYVCMCKHARLGGSEGMHPQEILDALRLLFWDRSIYSCRVLHLHFSCISSTRKVDGRTAYTTELDCHNIHTSSCVLSLCRKIVYARLFSCHFIVGSDSLERQFRNPRAPETAIYLCMYSCDLSSQWCRPICVCSVES